MIEDVFLGSDCLTTRTGDSGLEGRDTPAIPPAKSFLGSQIGLEGIHLLPRSGESSIQADQGVAQCSHHALEFMGDRGLDLAYGLFQARSQLLSRHGGVSRLHS